MLFLENRLRNAPSPAKAEKMTLVDTELPPNIPNATICAVTVVPILAPYMIVAACESEIIPAFTKPIVITVVAPELWMAAVPTAPIPTPRSLLPEALEKSFFSFSELAASRFELII